jgi:hypothetical protein
MLATPTGKYHHLENPCHREFIFIDNMPTKMVAEEKWAQRWKYISKRRPSQKIFSDLEVYMQLYRIRGKQGRSQYF